MITRKTVSQKGFRIDDRIIENIDILSQATDRSQNELAEKAFKMLFLDNIVYFIEYEVFTKLFNVTNGELGIGGLYFIVEDRVILIFSQNPNVYKDDILYESLKGCSPCKESDVLKVDLLLKIEKAKSYNSSLVNFFVIYNEAMFKYDLHSALTHIDLNFPQMQEWVKQEFDFS